MELFDTSVWAWRRRPEIEAWFSTAFVAGELVVCEMVALEILSGAPNQEWYEETRDLLEGVPWIHMGMEEWKRALEVHRLLEMQLGTNARRGVKHTDLLIAAAAETHDLALVHYDQDFDAIQKVTGQPMRWGAPRGTL